MMNNTFSIQGFRITLAFFFLCGVILSEISFASDRHPRPMVIHKLPELGLVVWTEMNPKWLVEKTSLKGQTVFTAQTPVATYPAAAFTFTSFKKLRINNDELKETAKVVIEQARKNYRSLSAINVEDALKARTYGVLTGYESTFKGHANGLAVDVKVFLGQVDGRAPILLQAYTPEGGLKLLSENIRRSWENITYLD